MDINVLLGICSRINIETIMPICKIETLSNGLSNKDRLDRKVLKCYHGKRQKTMNTSSKRKLK